MLAIPGTLALIAFIYMRPQEIAPALQSIPFLYLFVALAAIGWAVDVRLRFLRLGPSPLVGLGVLHFVWAMITVAAMAPHALPHEGLLSFMALFLFLAVSQGIQTFGALRVLLATLLGLTLFLTTVAIHQQYAPMGCVRQDDFAEDQWIP